MCVCVCVLAPNSSLEGSPVHLYVLLLITQDWHTVGIECNFVVIIVELKKVLLFDLQ